MQASEVCYTAPGQQPSIAIELSLFLPCSHLLPDAAAVPGEALPAAGDAGT